MPRGALILPILLALAALSCARATPLGEGTPYATRCAPEGHVRTLPLAHSVAVRVSDRAPAEGGAEAGGEPALRLRVKGDVVLRSLSGGPHSEAPTGAACRYALRVVANSVARASTAGAAAGAHEDEGLARAMPALDALHRWSARGEGLHFTLSEHGRAEDVSFATPLPADAAEAREVREAAWAVLAMLETDTGRIGKPAAEAFAAAPELREGHSVVPGEAYRLTTEYLGTLMEGGITDFNRRRAFRVHRPEPGTALLFHRDTHTQVFKRTGHGPGAAPADDSGPLYAQSLDIVRAVHPEGSSPGAAAVDFEIRAFTTLGDPHAFPDTRAAHDYVEGLAVPREPLKAAAKPAQRTGTIVTFVESVEAHHGLGGGGPLELRLSADGGRTGVRFAPAAPGALPETQYKSVEDVRGQTVHFLLQAADKAGGLSAHGRAALKLPGKAPVEGCISLPLHADTVAAEGGDAAPAASSAAGPAATARLCYTFMPRGLEAIAAHHIEASDTVAVYRDAGSGGDEGGDEGQEKPAEGEGQTQENKDGEGDGEGGDEGQEKPAEGEGRAQEHKEHKDDQTQEHKEGEGQHGQENNGDQAQGDHKDEDGSDNNEEGEEHLDHHHHVAADSKNLLAGEHDSADFATHEAAHTSQTPSGSTPLSSNPTGKGMRFQRRRPAALLETLARRTRSRDPPPAPHHEEKGEGNDGKNKEGQGQGQQGNEGGDGNGAAQQQTADGPEAPAKHDDEADGALKATEFEVGKPLVHPFGTADLGGEVGLRASGRVTTNAAKQTIASVAFHHSHTVLFQGRRLPALQFAASAHFNTEGVLSAAPVHWHTSVTQPVRMESAREAAHALLGFPLGAAEHSAVKPSPPRGKCADDALVDVDDFSAVMGSHASEAPPCLVGWRSALLLWGSRWLVDLRMGVTPSATVGLDLCPDEQSKDFFTVGCDASVSFGLDLLLRPAHGADWLDSPQSVHGPATCAGETGPGDRLAASAHVDVGDVHVAAAYRAPLGSPSSGCLTVRPKGSELGESVAARAEATEAKAAKSDLKASIDRVQSRDMSFPEAWTRGWCASGAEQPAAAPGTETEKEGDKPMPKQ